MQRLILLLSLIYASGPLYASDQIRYISDSFFVPLRVGPSNSHRIVHRGLKSGTQVTLLNIDKDKKFSQVRLGDGQTGWLPNRTLQAQPSAASQMAQLTEQLNLTQQQLDNAQQQLAQLPNLNHTNQQLRQQLHLNQQRVIALEQQHTDSQALQQQVQQLQKQKSQQEQDHWRKLGANSLVCILIGLLGGYWLNRRRRTKTPADW